MLASASTLDLLLTRLESSEEPPSNPFIVWTFASPGSPPFFHAFSSIKKFYRYLNSLDPDERNFCETIREGPQKPHFDVDIKLDELAIMRSPEDVIDELCFAIMRVCEDIKEQDIYIFSSTNQDPAQAPPTKRSYHIIVDNWYHATSFEAKRFYQQVKAEMPHDAAKFIDGAVYKTTQQFRMLGNTKPGQARHKVRVPDWNYFNKMTAMGIAKPGYQEFLASLVSYTDECQAMPSNYFHNVDPETENGARAEKYPELEHLECLVPSEYYIDVKSGLKPYGYRLLRRGVTRTDCLVCHRPHGTDTKGDNARLFVRDNKVFFVCFRDESRTPYLLDTLDTTKVTIRAELDKIKETAPLCDNNESKPIRGSKAVTVVDLKELVSQARNKGISSSSSTNYSVINKEALLRESRNCLGQ